MIGYIQILNQWKALGIKWIEIILQKKVDSSIAKYFNL